MVNSILKNCLVLFAFLILSGSLAWGQCQNSLNGIGNIGIHTTSPQFSLQINGSQGCNQQPTLFFSTEDIPIGGLLHLCQGTNYNLFSTLTTSYDFLLANKFDPNKDFTNNIVISNRDPEGRIIFGTTPPEANNDIERMTILNIGHVGIANSNPRELLQIGNRLTFHDGANEDFVGYNLFKDATNAFKRINEGYTQGLLFDYQGTVKLVSYCKGLANDEVKEWEGGAQWGAFKGIVVNPVSDDRVAIGLGSWPYSNTRTTIRGLGNDNQTYSLQAGNWKGGTSLYVRDDGRVSINNSDPKDIFQVGSMINFHDGANKILGFNSYWNGSQRVNYSGDIASMQIGADANGAFIEVDKQAAGAEVYKNFYMQENHKGIRLGANGNVGICHPDPQSRFVIHGASNDNTKSALNVMNYSGTSMMFVRNDGNIGIGTTTPNAKLQIKGNVIIGNEGNSFDIAVAPGFASKLSVDGIILAKEIRVTMTNWADYVFDPSYELTPLDELDGFIKENKHLPGVPTTAEVTANGISVSEMQSTLLKKVEELTLYMIEMKKENQALKAEIEKMKQNNQGK